MSGPVGGLADFTIRVNGAAVPPGVAHDVRAVTVEESVDEPSSFSIELSNWDDEKLQVAWSDGPLFDPGHAVEIGLGYLDDVRPVLSGEVTSLEPAFTAGSAPTLTVAGYGYAHRLARTRRTRSFVRMKDSAIAAQIGRESGLRVEATDTTVAVAYVAQANETDWGFLRRRAARIGYEVFVREKVLHFRAPTTAAKAQHTLAVGAAVSEFLPRLSAVGQVAGVTARGWDVTKKQVLVGRATPGQLDLMGTTRSGPVSADRAFGTSSTASVDLAPRTAAEAQMIARGLLATGALGFVQATARCGGDATLRAGTVVRIDGAGTRFSGPYYVTAVTHTLSAEQGYRTTLAVERNGA